jgi:hypothetical protein
MRLFLSVILFGIVFNSFSVLWPWNDWAKELKMRRLPVRLPTRAEIAELAGQATDDNPAPLREEVMLSVDSLWDYFKPWPGRATRAHMRTWKDGGKWALTWLTTRLGFVEEVLGVPEEWPMFSPSASRRKWVARARLIYSDGGERIIRGKCDPEDLTRYSHWFEEKVLDYELKVKERRDDDNYGYCNLLMHRYARTDGGAELVRIVLYQVRYDLPPPDVNAHDWLEEQTGPPPAQVYKAFYEFDVPACRGKPLPGPHD